MSKVILLGRSLFKDEYDIVNIQVNYGKLAECFFLYDEVCFLGEANEILDLIGNLGQNILLQVINNGRLKLALMPETFGVFSPHGVVDKFLPQMLVGPLKDLRDGDKKLNEVLEEIADGYKDVHVPPELNDLVNILPKELAEKICKSTYNDLTNNYYLKFASKQISDYFDRICYLADNIFSVSLENGISPLLSNIDTEEKFEYWSKTFSNDIIVLLLVNELICFSQLSGINIFYTNELIQILSSYKLKFVPQSTDKLVKVFRKTLEVNDVPDIEFLVNQELLDIKEVYKSSNSSHGKSLRKWLKEFLDSEEDLNDNEAFYKYYINSIQNVEGFDKVRENGLYKTIKFGIVSLAGLFIQPVASLALGGADFVVDNLIPQKWKPNLFAKKYIKDNINIEQLESRKENPIKYTNVFKIIDRGYNLLYLKIVGEEKKFAIVKLEKSEGKNTFNIELPQVAEKHVAELLAYYEKNFCEEYRELIEKLLNGWEVTEINHNFTKGETTNALITKVYIKKGNEELIIEADSPDLFYFVSMEKWKWLKNN